MLSAKCDLQDIFVHFHFISHRFVGENGTPLGAIVLVRQFLSLHPLVTAEIEFFFYMSQGLAFTRVVIFN